MKEIKILEIPIYSMKQEVFSKKWNNFFEKNYPKNEYFEDVKRIYFPRTVWQYNQIIGYLVITYSQNTIWFNEYGTLDRNIHAVSKTKHFIENMYLGGYHFHIEDTMSNKGIQEEILYWINSFEKDIMNKNYYLDKENFIYLLKYIDIKNLIKDK